MPINEDVVDFYIMKRLLLTILLFTIVSTYAELSQSNVNKIEAIIKKYKTESKLSQAQQFSLNATIAMELKQYGYMQKASEYFQKAISMADKAKEANEKYELYTEYLFHLTKLDEKKAKEFYIKTYRPTLKKSDYNKRDELLSFWSNHFSKDPKLNRPFFNQHYKVKKLKKLIEEKKYSEAYKVIEKSNPRDSSINRKLEFDILTVLNHKNKELYCLDMLKRYPKSYAVTVEVCRYLKDRKLKFGTLDALIERSKEEQPQILYIVKALKDIK